VTPSGALTPATEKTRDQGFRNTEQVHERYQPSCPRFGAGAAVAALTTTADVTSYPDAKR
jgi:hypothetical protein